MPNTSSAKKALKQSKKKRQHNLFWKRRIRDIVKNIRKQLAGGGVNADIIKKEESTLYKVIDKALKNNVIKKNKANRLKSKVARELFAHGKPTEEAKSKKSTKSKTAKKAVSKSKSKKPVSKSKNATKTKAKATKTKAKSKS